MPKGGDKNGYKQVELIVEYGGDGESHSSRSEEEAYEVVQKIMALAARLGLADPYVEDYHPEERSELMP